MRGFSSDGACVWEMIWCLGADGKKKMAEVRKFSLVLKAQCSAVNRFYRRTCRRLGGSVITKPIPQNMWLCNSKGEKKNPKHTHRVRGIKWRRRCSCGRDDERAGGLKMHSKTCSVCDYTFLFHCKEDVSTARTRHASVSGLRFKKMGLLYLNMNPWTKQDV